MPTERREFSLNSTFRYLMNGLHERCACTMVIEFGQMKCSRK